MEIWSDVVCPWCYVGKRRFEAAVADFGHPVEVLWRSFQLDPDATSAPAGAHASLLARKFGTSLEQAQSMLDTMTATAAQEGLEFHFDQARSANTLDAHRLLHLAAEQGLQGALKERLVASYFTEGEAVDDPATLARLAEQVGLDGDQVRSVLTSDRFTDRVRDDQAQAHSLGITGVPFFVLDGRLGLSGAQPAEVLLQALEQAWTSRPQTLTMTAVPQSDSCDDGGCEVPVGAATKSGTPS